MRIPLVRFGEDDRPIERWEYFFIPVVGPLSLLGLALFALVSIPVFWLYPERHMNVIDLQGTPDEKRELRRYRLYRARVPVWRRVLERLRLVNFDAPPPLPKRRKGP